ncbi:hypothetical protein NHX12_021633, partial [Muraenolepis orangiensis]
MSRSSRLVRPGSNKTGGSRLPGLKRQSAGDKLMKDGSDGGLAHPRSPGPEPGDKPQSRDPDPVLGPHPGRVQGEDGDLLVPQSSKVSPPEDTRTLGLQPGPDTRAGLVVKEAGPGLWSFMSTPCLKLTRDLSLP